MKNDLGLSLERYASASGIQHIYSLKSGIEIQKLNEDKIYPPILANKALEGDKAAVETFSDCAKYLALLFYERIVSLYCGSQEIFEFINPNRDKLEKSHPYLKYVFDRFRFRFGIAYHSSYELQQKDTQKSKRESGNDQRFYQPFG